MPTASELRNEHLAMLANRRNPKTKEQIVSFAESVLQDYSPSKDLAYAYAMLGAVVSSHLKQHSLSYVQLSPSVLAKAFKGKDRKLGAVVRGIMTPDTPQFQWMSAVLVETFKLGVVVSIDDTLLFIDLGSDEVKQMERMRVTDVQKSFEAIDNL